MSVTLAHIATNGYVTTDWHAVLLADTCHVPTRPTYLPCGQEAVAVVEVGVDRLPHLILSAGVCAEHLAALR
jgi:hypothetical protein